MNSEVIGLPLATEGTQEFATAHQLYKISVETDRYDGYMKHAFILDPSHGTNIALMTNLSLHQMDADKTNVQNLIKGFKKIKYEATEVKTHFSNLGKMLFLQHCQLGKV